MKLFILILNLLITSVVFAKQENKPENQSDARVKKIISPANNESDLQKISKIEVFIHTMKDFHKYGKNQHTDLTAQQIESFLPEIIFTTSDIIPNVFSIAEDVTPVGTETFISSRKPHNFKTGDEIKLIIENKGEKIIKVSKVIDEKQFTINGVINNNVFIYGKKVNDLRNINYNKLTVLNLSAIQALNKLIKILSEKNLKLVNNIQNLNERINDLEKFLLEKPETILSPKISKPQKEP